MKVSKLEKGIFSGDSAATSHMTSDMTGVHNLQHIKGSVMIGNGHNIQCTHKGKLDVICKHKDGTKTKDTWDSRIVPHDSFYFTCAMKEG